jgi:hypothetical protein
VCVLPAKTPCINDWNGDLTVPTQAARFFHYGNSGGNNRILVTLIGTISGCGTSGGFQPFADGSDLNCRYNDRPVYQLQWAKNGPSGICIAGEGEDENAFNDGCARAGAAVWFAYSSYSDLISVGASNVYYDEVGEPNSPVWLGSDGIGNTGNGVHVYLTPVQNYNLPWGFNTDGG